MAAFASLKALQCKTVKTGRIFIKKLLSVFDH